MAGVRLVSSSEPAVGRLYDRGCADQIIIISGEQAGKALEHFRASAIFLLADGDVRATADSQGDHHYAH
jgi:hypothetical protein